MFFPHTIAHNHSVTMHQPEQLRRIHMRQHRNVYYKYRLQSPINKTKQRVVVEFHIVCNIRKYNVFKKVEETWRGIPHNNHKPYRTFFCPYQHPHIQRRQNN